MKKLILLFAIMAYASLHINAQCSSHKSSAQKTSYSHEKNIVSIATGSDDFTTLVAALKAADLVGALQGDGPFTVFAPTNGAFNKLPEGTVSTLLETKNKNTLSNILTYHVVAGKFDANAVVNAIQANGGTAKLTTLNGGTLKASLSGKDVILTDENGNRSLVTTVDLKGSNGVIHVIDSVVLPK